MTRMIRVAISTLRIGAAAALTAALSAPAAFAQSCTPASWKSWSVQSNFRGDKARTQLSGAACDATASRCIAVNDEKEYAQFFTMSGSAITPGNTVDLVTGDDEPDAEGAAFAGDFFYVTGSHGSSRKKNKPNDASYVVARIDAKSGLVNARSAKWRGAISASKELGPYAGQPLKDGGPDKAGGANVEGIAVWKDRMYLGFRGPSIGSKAFLLSAPVAEVFSDPNIALAARSQTVTLGARAGIRDLAAVPTGLLILSGPVDDEPVTPAIYHWNPETETLDMLAQLTTLAAGVKAETILVLGNNEEGKYRVMLIFEGAANGGPVECSIPKPK
jgi:Protein of unknown function (DUF3616)